LAAIEVDGKQIELKPDMMTIERKTFKQSGKSFFSVFR
jgi:hypothetical protein